MKEYTEIITEIFGRQKLDDDNDEKETKIT